MEQALNLPNDLDALQALVLKLQQENRHLQEQVRLLLHKRFGAKSEKYPAEQSDLFNEAEAYAEDSDDAESPFPITAPG